jgi:hypothetical protein
VLRRRAPEWRARLNGINMAKIRFWAGALGLTLAAGAAAAAEVAELRAALDARACPVTRERVPEVTYRQHCGDEYMKRPGAYQCQQAVHQMNQVIAEFNAFVSSCPPSRPPASVKGNAGIAKVAPGGDLPRPTAPKAADPSRPKSAAARPAPSRKPTSPPPNGAAVSNDAPAVAGDCANPANSGCLY